MTQLTQSRQAQPTTTDPILVLGGTGKTGKRIVARLRTAGRDVRPASRRSTPQFDWDEPSTWSGVLAGVSTVYLALPLTPAPVAEFVEHAVASGVRRLVALSGRGADQWQDGFGQEMLDLERAVRSSGVQWTILRSSNFAQNFSEDVFYGLVMAGELALPVGSIPEPFIDVEDVVDVAVRTLTSDDWVDQILELTGPEALTWDEAVATIAGAARREVRFTDLPPQEYRVLLQSQGIPAADAHALETMFTEIRRGLLTEPTDGVLQVLGRQPRTFADYAAAAAAAGAWD
ncbi:MAG TPA: NAD(P)H-binding protein [Candidatus Ruania gallistercoris]|uniref:NAD(P)H-binding protein n=1 Tax=Candidatus Ruania gallistercoris TaxID=2838746 RepID=A0A9D2EI61_9MICO|nr:NAD(P)H-binding protein [Candidatus Ruania gallistercoris]